MGYSCQVSGIRKGSDFEGRSIRYRVGKSVISVGF